MYIYFLRIFCAGFTLFLSVLNIFILMRGIQLKMNAGYISAAIFILLFNYALLQLCINAAPGYDRKGNYSAALYNVYINFSLPIFAALLLVFAADVFLLCHTVRFRETAFSPMSYKEAADNLPIGICCYAQNGRVLLINRLMMDIGFSGTGNAVLNGGDFWQYITQSGTKLQNGYILLLGEKVFYAEQNMLEDEISEICAYDVTELHKLGAKASENNERLRKQNQKLRDMNELITQMTIQKEMLDAKMMIHDEFGTALAATHRYLSGPAQAEDIDIDKLQSLWRKNIKMFGNYADEAHSDHYTAVFKAAADVGIEIKTEGTLPSTGRAAKTAAYAIRQCITNTIRHANGNAIYITSQKENNTYTLGITNNGRRPETEIAEKGGLKSLRQLTESAGGKMTVKSLPVFELTIVIEE